MQDFQQPQDFVQWKRIADIVTLMNVFRIIILFNLKSSDCGHVEYHISHVRESVVKDAELCCVIVRSDFPLNASCS